MWMFPANHPNQKAASCDIQGLTTKNYPAPKCSKILQAWFGGRRSKKSSLGPLDQLPNSWRTCHPPLARRCERHRCLTWHGHFVPAPHPPMGLKRASNTCLSRDQSTKSHPKHRNGDHIHNVCMYACMHAMHAINVCMYICMHACMHAMHAINVCMSVCLCVCMYVCT